MSSIPTIALNGLNAAATKLQVSASNTVNQLSSGTPGKNDAYKAREVVQSSSAGSGPVSHIKTKNPATVISYAPHSPLADSEGYTEFPNVDIATEFVNMSQAKNSYQASLKILESWNEMQETLLDIKS